MNRIQEQRRVIRQSGVHRLNTNVEYSVDRLSCVFGVASVRLVERVRVQLALEMPEQRGRREHEVHLLAAHLSHVHGVLDLREQ